MSLQEPGMEGSITLLANRGNLYRLTIEKPWGWIMRLHGLRKGHDSSGRLTVGVPVLASAFGCIAQ